MRKVDAKTKEIPAKRVISQRLFERFLLPCTALLVLLHLATIYLIPQYMWGVHFYHFFPAWIGWTLTMLVLTTLIPGVREFLYAKSEALAGKIDGAFARESQNKIFILLSLLSIPIFWIFRTRLHLLGDGYFRINDLPAGKLHLAEWGDGFIHLEVYRAMLKIIPNWTPELTYSIISILCGAAFIFISLKLCSLLGKNGFQKALIFFFLVSLGSIQLFFGYVESYTILQVALLVYIWLAALAFTGRISVVPPLVVLVINIGLHVTCLIYVPSFIYLLWERRAGSETQKGPASTKDESSREGISKRRKAPLMARSPKVKPILSTPILIALILSLVIVAFWVHKVATGLEEVGKGMFILPLMATPAYPFGMFSAGHISEFVNQLLLLSPVGLSLIVFFLFFKIRLREFDDRLTNFLILSTVLALVYLFVVNFTLGSADWDLRSAPAPFLGLLAVLLFLRWAEDQSATSSSAHADGQTSTPVGNRIKAWGAVFVCVGLFHTVPWVLINASHSRSVSRYTLIQENDPHPVDATNYNLFKVARILKFANLPDEVIKLYERAIERNPADTLSYFNLASIYGQNQRYDQAILILDSLFRIDPLYPKANWLMGHIYVKMGQYAKALPYLEKALPYLSDNADYLFDLGSAYYETDHLLEAGTCASAMIELKPGATEGYHLLGLAHVRLGHFEEAKEAWENILTINPADSTAILNLMELENLMKRNAASSGK
ncbi:MAG: tetratricopeptide repeat protein [Candidatus Zixiibacteriota bacterium]